MTFPNVFFVRSIQPLFRISNETALSLRYWPNQCIVIYYYMYYVKLDLHEHDKYWLNAKLFEFLALAGIESCTLLEKKVILTFLTFFILTFLTFLTWPSRSNVFWILIGNDKRCMATPSRGKHQDAYNSKYLRRSDFYRDCRDLRKLGWFSCARHSEKSVHDCLQLAVTKGSNFNTFQFCILLRLGDPLSPHRFCL